MRLDNVVRIKTRVRCVRTQYARYEIFWVIFETPVSIDTVN